jgi:hypothetical protein
MEMGPTALQHRDKVEEVKRRMGINHDFSDCWIYNFLENKFFDVEETVAKLYRRDAMERDEISGYEVTDFMREQMSKGLIQLIGDDREGRVTFYIVTARDRPLAAKRDENKRNFDMWMSYGTRLRKENRRCRITMLINQEGASMWSNTDMAFQSNIALRIAKYYPGCVDRMYICCMGRALSALAKPIFKSLPKVVSERIFIITESEMEKGKLLEYFEPHILPRALGGQSDMDNKENWLKFATIIESHFMLVRGAIREGKRVKEWEVEELQRQLREEQIQKAEASVRLLAGAASSPRVRAEAEVSEEDGDLRTCESFDGDEGGDDREMTSLKNIHVRHWQKSLSPLSRIGGGCDLLLGGEGACGVYGVFEMLERHEAFFRLGVAELEVADYLRLCDYFSTHALRLTSSMGHDGQDMAMLLPSSRHRLALTCPKPLRSVARALLWIMCLIISVYFFAGTVFLAGVACSITVLMFFGIFVHSYYVFPLGLGVLVAGYEGCMLTSRGVELVRFAFRGQLMPFLTFLGSKGLTVQALLFALIILGQFIVFVVFSSITDPLTGLRISFATGWLTCAVLIAVHHLTFSQMEEHGRQEKNQRAMNLGALSLYLFLDITEDSDHMRSPGVELALCSIPITLSIISGLAFIVTKAVFFLVAGIVTTMGSAFAVNFFTEGGHTDHTTTLIRLVTLLASISWLFLFYAVGHGDHWLREFRPLVIVVSTLTAILVVICGFIRMSAKPRQSVMRVSFFILLCFFITGVCTLYVVHWALGLFVTLMIIQAGICFVRSSRSTTLIGTLLITVGSLSMMTAVILFGYQAASAGYASPYNQTLTLSHLRHELERMSVDPLCFIQFGFHNSSLDVLKIGLLATLSFASTVTNAFAVDFMNWAPEFTYAGSLEFSSNFSNMPFSGVVFNSDLDNVTVVVLRSSTDPLLSVETLTMWVEALSLSVFKLILPTEWTVGLIAATDFTNFLIPFRWRQGLDTLEESLRVLRNKHSNRHVILTGFGVGGGVAAIMSARLGVIAVTFENPGIYLSRAKFGIPANNVISDRLLEVVSDSGGFGGIDSHGENEHVVRCGAYTPCRSLFSLLEALQKSCQERAS